MTIESAETERPRRTLLFVPGKRIEIYPKAVATGADMVCIDLEDALADGDKAAGRSAAFEFIRNGAGHSVETVLRINSLRTAAGLADMLALIEADVPPDGIMLSKVGDPEEVRIAEDGLRDRHPDLLVHAWIENARGLAAAHEIAGASPRLASLSLGGYDMAADLRVEPGWDTLLHARSRLVVAAASAGIDLLDAPFFGLDDPDGLAAEAAAAKRLGFTGKTNIHPKQIEIVNGVFTPDAGEVARARKLIAEYESRPEGFFLFEGEVLEAPVIKQYYRILAIAERAGL